MNKLLEKTWKTEKGAKDALIKLLEEEKTGNWVVSFNEEEEVFSLRKTQVPRSIQRRSVIESPCAHVWGRAEELYAQNYKRGQIIQACIDDGVAFHTARTQYQQWFTAMKNSDKI